MDSSVKKYYKNSTNFPIGIFSQTSYLPDPHHHIEYELFYLHSGSAIFGIDNYEIKIEAGSVIFINPDTTHYVKKAAKDNDFLYYSIVFDSSVLGHDGDPILSTFTSIHISRLLQLPEYLLKQIQDTAVIQSKKTFGYELMTKTVLFEIISYIIQTKQYVEISDKIAKNKNHSISAIDVCLKYIHEHYRESITMDDLLQITSYSKSHFIRLFKKYTGLNLTDYINKYRIEKSCLDLLYTNKNITEIATENGFNTVQYFSKIFKNCMNCTPKKYQKEGRNIIIPSSLCH